MYFVILAFYIRSTQIISFVEVCLFFSFYVHDIYIFNTVIIFTIKLTLHESVFFAQESLCVLNINNNNIDEIRDLAVLKEIQHFSAADNKLHNMEVNIAFKDFSIFLQNCRSGN